MILFTSVRAVARIIGLVLMASLFSPPVILLWALTLEKLRARMVNLFHKLACRICGIRLKVEGRISNARPMMLVSNHSCYLDIFILGSLAPMSFTPKREIRSWPVIGFFCILADCVFIERRPAAMEEAKAEMEMKLAQGKVLTLFPEGTTGDGFHVKPFKSGFLNLVETHDLPVQPISLAYTHIGATPLNAQNRDHVAWIGEASLVTHLFRLMCYPSVSVTAQFYPLIRSADVEDRKVMAKRCEETIRTGLHQTLEQNGVTS